MFSTPPGSRTTAKLLLIAMPLALALLAGCQGGGGGSAGGGRGSMNTLPRHTSPAKPGDVSGRYIVTISDADLSAPALHTGRLGERDPQAQDTLTVISLPIREPVTPFAQIQVSNSVIGPPNALAVTRDGRMAFVAESRGPAPATAVTIADLPPGRMLFAVDLSDPLQPGIIGATDVGRNPMAVDVHPDGDLVAVVTSAPYEQVVIVPIHGTQVGEPLAWPLIGLDDASAVPTSIAWSPQGNVLAVNVPDHDLVLFYAFRRDRNDGSMGLALLGAPVRVGKYPYSGRFTPDGRHFITTDLQWGRDVEEFRVGATEGQLTVVRVGEVDLEHTEQSVHQVVSTATVGVSPEGLAVSHDGRFVVTANLRRSYLDEADPRLTRGGSVSLLSLDQASGALTLVGEHDLDGMPEGLAFDARGNFIVVTQFRSFDPNVIDGELVFLRLGSDSRGVPILEETDFRVGVGKGPHGVLIVR